VGYNEEKIRSKGGNFRSEAMRSSGRDTREREREIGTKIELLLSRVGATNLERPYKLGIYTPS
jgi:hypothetical protein